jgi:hypothetical protein
MAEAGSESVVFSLPSELKNIIEILRKFQVREGKGHQHAGHKK